MGFFSRKSKALREEAKNQARASTDGTPMNRSSSTKQARGRPAEIVTDLEHLGHSKSAPSSPRRYFGHSRNASSKEFVYTTDPDAPPVPQPPKMKYGNVPVPPRNPRRSNDHFASQSPPKGIGNTFADRKRSELAPSSHHYADSGYGSNGSFSAAHSRAPSEANYYDDTKQPLPRNENGLLPDLKLGEDSFSQGFISNEAQSNQKYQDSYFTQRPDVENEGNISPVESEADLRRPRPTRSASNISKRTRFEDTPELPTLDQLQDFHCAPLTNPAKSKSAPQDAAFAVDGLSEFAAAAVGAASIGDRPFLDTPSQESELQTKYMGTPVLTLSEQTVTPPTMRRSSQALPPLSILEGFKVNKKGRILDEEGDPIGELVEGDLLDCVRQKANAQGEVIDDYGRVVGIVRTILQGAELKTPASTSTSVKQESQPRSEPIRSPLVVPIPKQTMETHEPQSPPRVLSPVVESPRLGRPGSAERDFFPPANAVPDSGISPPRQSLTLPQAQQPQEELAMPQAETTSKEMVMQEQPKRMSTNRSLSERSLSELSKTWARPNMDSVPENHVAAEAEPPLSPGLYSFRGEIPADDRPQREARSRSPHVAINAKAALALGQPNSAMFGPSSSGPYAHGGRMGSRRATTHFAGSYANGTLSITPASRPYKPSPLSSQETSPKRSDAEESISDDGKFYGKAPSVAASVYSVATTTTKPRTYFTHSGKVTVDPNTLPPTKAVEAMSEPAVKERTKEEKKKSRLSMGFGRKTVAK